MDQATQQNAALVEQSAAAADSLQRQAQELVDAVAVFRLGAERGAARVPSPRPQASAVASPAVRRPAVRPQPVTASTAPALAPASVAGGRNPAEGDWESF
ncbi:Methyl-accepting chemotaxis protein III [compost metagenome]